MDDPLVVFLVTVGAAIAAWLIVRVLGWLLDWWGRRNEAERRVREEARQAERARIEEEKRARLAEIDDTRNWLLDYTNGVVMIGDGRIDQAQALYERMAQERYPHFRWTLIADEKLVDEMCTLIPEVFERIGRLPEDLRLRLGRLPNVVRNAFRKQEDLVRRTGQPLFRTSAQAVRIGESQDRVLAAIKRYDGLMGALRGLWTRFSRM